MRSEIVRRADEAERRENQRVNLTIEGGIPLEGRVELQGAKNLALQAIAASILTTDTVTLDNFPRIGDTDINLSILMRLGAQVEETSVGSMSIVTKGITHKAINRKDSIRSTGSRYFIPTLARTRGSVIAGPPGGDRIGAPERFVFRKEDLEMYERIGIGNKAAFDSEGRPCHEFFPLKENKPTELRLDGRYFGPTVQALLSYAGTDGEFVVINPCLEPEITDTVELLNSMGADIEYRGDGSENGEDFIHIKGNKYLHGTKFRIKSDPNAMASYAAMALITNGDVVIEGVDHSSKMNAFINILMGMNVYFEYGGGILHLYPSSDRMMPVNLRTDFWPAECIPNGRKVDGSFLCHTDWQQLFTSVLATLEGTSHIDENVYAERFKQVPALNALGAKLHLIRDPNRIIREAYKSDGNPHTLRIDGPVNFHNLSSVTAPLDIRGATSVLVALLSAKGKTDLYGAEQILRGLDKTDRVLQELGAKISASVVK